MGVYDFTVNMVGYKDGRTHAMKGRSICFSFETSPRGIAVSLKIANDVH